MVSDGGDLTISEQTEIDFRLDSVDDRSYQLVMEQRYSFRNWIPTAKVVIFATSAPRLRDSIISGCRLPLFELWFVRDDLDEPRFEDSVEAMRESVRVGIQFADARGRIHDVEARNPGPHLREVSCGTGVVILTSSGRTAPRTALCSIGGSTWTA